MAPSKTPGQANAASDKFLKKQAEAQGLGAPNAPAHKEPHAPGEAPVASDSGIVDAAGIGDGGGGINVPGEKGLHDVKVSAERVNPGNSMTNAGV